MTEGKRKDDNDRGEGDSMKTVFIEKWSLVQTFKGFGSVEWIRTWKMEWTFSWIFHFSLIVFFVKNQGIKDKRTSRIG